jgi:hypothetical protein
MQEHELKYRQTDLGALQSFPKICKLLHDLWVYSATLGQG